MEVALQRGHLPREVEPAGHLAALLAEVVEQVFQTPEPLWLAVLVGMAVFRLHRRGSKAGVDQVALGLAQQAELAGREGW
ncbi:hypothetical protein [Phenylobacterium sp.]|jgi:hypothetical protein|uniref:hypothetical protein n=1 Tax=Phenylobacterium sp. TaxID=1871053 RepID=UPI0037C61E8D